MRLRLGNLSLKASLLCLILNLCASCSFNRAALIAPVAQLNNPAPSVASRVNEGAFSPEDSFNASLKLKLQGRSEEAKIKLEEIRTRSPKTVWYLRASFLLGTIGLEGKNPGTGEAAETYLKDALALKDVEDYVLFNLARAYRVRKNFNGAVASYNSIIEFYPLSALVPGALYEKASTLEEAGDLNSSRAAFEGFIKAYPRNPAVSDALLKAAEVSLRLDDATGALKALRRLFVRYPETDAATGVKKLMTAKKAKDILSSLTVEERYHRGRKLFEAGRYLDASAEFSRAAKGSDGELHDSSVISLATTQIKLKNYARAEKTLTDYINKETSCGNEEEALGLLGLAALRQGKIDSLIDIKERLEEKYPGSRELADSIMYIGRYYEYEKDFEKAASAYKEMLGFKGEAAGEAAWRIGWLAYRKGRFETAYRHFNSYAASAPKGKEPDRLFYWSGRSAEKVGLWKQALEAYSEACSPSTDSYYCRLSQERMASLIQTSDPEKETREPAETVETPPPAAEKAVSSEPGPALSPGLPAAKEITDSRLDLRYPAALELLTLGMASNAAMELEGITERHKGDPASLVELTGLFYQAGDYYRALRVYRKNQSAFLYITPGASEDSVPFSTYLGYPLKLVDTIRDIAPEDSADPYLVAAVMREESGFNPAAVSPVGALGLMQIMPSTGDFIEKEIGSGDPLERKDLLNAVTNIRLGSWYLGLLARNFDNDLALTIAGYNAGPQAASRWAKTCEKAEPDEFIESIPYTETRYYVKRVIRSYSEFLRLAGLEWKGLFGRPILKRKPVKDPASPPPAATTPEFKTEINGGARQAM